MSRNDDWLDGIIRKRPETVLLLHALVLIGLRKGCVTAEDGHHIPVSHPNCRGAAMKLLAKSGFVKEFPTRGSTEQSHGHWLFRWRLEDVQQARQVVNRLNHAAAQINSEPRTGQMLLAV